MTTPSGIDPQKDSHRQNHRSEDGGGLYGSDQPGHTNDHHRNAKPEKREGPNTDLAHTALFVVIQ